MEALLRNLKTAIFNVLEKMYFLVPDADEDMLPLPMEERTYRSIHIGMKGAPPYVLTFSFDRELAWMMAADILGMDEEEMNEELVETSLKETANIIAGNFLLNFDGDPLRNITLPETDRNAVFGGPAALDSRMLDLSFNGYSMKAVVETVATDHE